MSLLVGNLMDASCTKIEISRPETPIQRIIFVNLMQAPMFNISQPLFLKIMKTALEPSGSLQVTSGRSGYWALGAKKKKCCLIQRPGLEEKNCGNGGKMCKCREELFVGLTFSSSWLACCCGAFHLP